MSKLIQAITNGNTNTIIQVIFDAQQTGGINGHLPLLLERNRLGESPLICAIKKKYMYVAEVLIGLDPDLDYAVPNTGDTAMMYAAKLGHENIIRELIDAGADITIKNRNNQTASDIAIDYNHPEAAPDSIILIQGLAQNLQGLNINRNVIEEDIEENKEKPQEEKTINKNPIAYINPVLIQGTIGSSDLLGSPIAPYNYNVPLSGHTDTEGENPDS